jgi:uncharacterized membrane protein YhaH (DUF805 family)
MNWRQFLLSFNGRVGRKQYWLMVLLTVPFVIAATLINGIACGSKWRCIIRQWLAPTQRAHRLACVCGHH